jgi:hypothetical protein
VKITFKSLVIPVLGASLILHNQPHTAHSLYAGAPTTGGGSAEAMVITATASTVVVSQFA